jgi:hypothetical protein
LLLLVLLVLLLQLGLLLLAHCSKCSCCSLHCCQQLAGAAAAVPAAPPPLVSTFVPLWDSLPRPFFVPPIPPMPPVGERLQGKLNDPLSYQKVSQVRKLPLGFLQISPNSENLRKSQKISENQKIRKSENQASPFIFNIKCSIF